MDGRVRHNMRDKILDIFKNKINGRKKGFLSIIYVIMILGAVVIMTGVFTVYQHQLIVRNFEAAADLAAVESLRQHIDEAALRNEDLLVKPEKMDSMRAAFLDKIRKHMPSNTYEIIRIEIPEINTEGKVVFNSDEVKTMTFPNSESAAWEGPTTIVDGTRGFSRTSYFVGGTTSDNCAMELARISGNLATSGSKEKDSYILTSKVTIFFKTTSSINALSSSMLNYVNILSDNERQIITEQVDRGIIAVTIQAIGEVVMR